eukprot:jgi/Undpi1/10934/HiC_scaffold_3.g01460.m1
MDASSETLALRRQLEKAVSGEDVERVTDVLESLGGVNMTLALLKESKVGSAVAKLKKHADERVSNSAKALVRKWKKVAEASGVQGTAKPEKPASPKGAMTAATVVSQSAKPTDAGKESGVGGAGPNAGPGGAAGAGAGAEAGAGAGMGGGGQPICLSWKTGEGCALRRYIRCGALPPLSAEVLIEDALAEVGLAPFRLKMRRKIFDTLTLEFTDGDRLPVAKVSKDVEWAMNENSPYLRKKDDYLAKARQLAFNLKKNEQLRQDVREGLVAPERLVVMTSTELMSKDKREAMDKAVSDRTEARMLDWYDKNKDKINKQCGIKEQEGMFECGRCKSTKTTYTQKQTRSADEPMTTFVTCGNCKNRWKFC